MENSNLNLAHYHGRRAENHFRHRRYDKAIENYHKASNFTEEAMKGVSSPSIQVSLKLQLQDYKRQINLISLKKVLLEKYMKGIERQREADQSRKRSPSSGGSLQSTATIQGSGASPKVSNEDSVDDDEFSSSLIELELETSEIPHLAPLELPPLLDFESFRFNKPDKSDL